MVGRAAALALVVALAVPATAQVPELPVPGPTASPRLVDDVDDHDCTVVGTEGDDDLAGTEGPDVVCGLGGADIVRGLGGSDELRGGEGDDTLLGGPGDDVLAGETGLDAVSYADVSTGVAVDLAAGIAHGDGADALVGIERVIGSALGDALHGSVLPDVLEGGDGVDLIYGGEGDDVLDGGEGDDFLAGGAGADDLDGGAGANICHALPDLGTQTGCWDPNPTDPRDTKGPLDLRRVHARLEGSRPAWRVATASRWSTRRVWDEGYVAVLLDTRGGPEADHYAVARSTKRRMTATLYRVRPNARDRAVRGGVRAWRANARSVTIRIALRRVGLDPLRPYYRWGVRTLFTGKRCRFVCIDPAGFDGAMFPQPRS